MKDLKKILQNSFYQLLIIYTILVVLISLSLFWKYSLHMSIFAFIVGILGISIIKKKKSKASFNKKLHLILFIIAILLIIDFRVIPYLSNSIPLGYDVGIYKYGIESFIEKGFGVDDWVKGALTPGFLYLMWFIAKIFSTQAILTWIFILFNLILGLSIYFLAKEYFDKRTAIIAFLIYAVSLIQFKVFTFMYYKNVIALSLALWALYFLKKEKRKSFIIFGALTGAMHRPTFFIFGLAYLLFTIKDYKKWATNITNGVWILFLTLIFYTGSFQYSILPLINPALQGFIQPGTSPGTFISFFTYQFSTLAYLPFAILGFCVLIKRKQFNMLFFWTLITAIIVYFQFFFFNRFIIHLDIALIILAGLGFSILIEDKRKLGTIILIVLLFSASLVAFNEARNTEALISKEQLDLIKKFNNVEQGASVISISSEYSPWVLGYSGRKTIAPGLFDENKWTKQEWEIFWATQDKNETISLMSVYQKPVYIFSGTKVFNNTCFEPYLSKNNNKIHKYIC